MRGLDPDEARVLGLMLSDGDDLYADRATRRVLARLVAQGRVRTYRVADPTGARDRGWSVTPLGALAWRVARDLPLPALSR